jgi:hypothetical protein
VKYAEDRVIEKLRAGETPAQIRAQIKHAQPTLSADFYAAGFALEYLESGEEDDLRSEPVRSSVVAFLRRIAQEVPEYSGQVESVLRLGGA